MKKYLYNPKSGSSIKNWYDGTNYWNLEVDEVAAFPEGTGEKLQRTYGFLQELSPEEFEVQLAKLEKVEPVKIKVDADGSLQPKSEEEMEEDKKSLEVKKEKVKALKKKVKEAKDAEPAKPKYWELSRGALINEINKREIEVKGLNKKGVNVTKEQLINYLENYDKNK